MDASLCTGAQNIPTAGVGKSLDLKSHSYWGEHLQEIREADLYKILNSWDIDQPLDIGACKSLDHFPMEITKQLSD